METVTIQKKEYEKLRRLAGKTELTEMEIKSLASTLQILQDKEMMKDIKESLENLKKGKTWKSKY